MSSLLDGSNSLDPFIITVSARALFDMDEAHQVYESQGLNAFREYQLKHADVPLGPGPIFHLVQKLLNFNETKPEHVRPFEIVLLSRNSTETALRIFNTIDDLKMPLIRAVFTGGEPSSNYVEAIGADLFLSSNPDEVARVINECQIPAATVFQSSPTNPLTIDPTEIRIAFDGDAVVFSDEAEHVFGNGGIKAFCDHEYENAARPLMDGPFRSMLSAICEIQKAFPEGESPIRTALVTARSMPTHLRVLNTLSNWGLTVDNAMFLGGKNKAPYLKAFKADLFFDDSRQNIEHALTVMTGVGHVPYGIRNAAGSANKKFTGTDEVRVGKMIPIFEHGEPEKKVIKEPDLAAEPKISKSPKQRVK